MRKALTKSLFLATAVVLVGLAAVSPAQAQIGTPVDIGSIESDGVTATSLVVTTTKTVPKGASIIVIASSTPTFGETGAAPIGVACSDGAKNIYSTDVTQGGNGGVEFVSISSTHGLATELPAGSTITVAWSGGDAAVEFSQRVHAFSVTGLASEPLDKIASAFGPGATPSSGAVTTTQGNELLFGAIFSLGAGVSGTGFTPGRGYTSLGGVGTVQPCLLGEYDIVSATGSYAATGSFSISGGWFALLATYEAAPPVFDVFLRDNTTGDVLQWNTTTGQYMFTMFTGPSDGFTLTGTGVVKVVNGIQTLTDSKADRRVSAGFNSGQQTGTATIYFQYAPGLWESFVINDTSPGGVCA